MRVALIYQPRLPAAHAMAKLLASWLEDRAVASELRSTEDLEAPPGGVELAISLGGDGTVLRVARWLGGQPVPLVPVKMGTVNFLGELELQGLPDALEPTVTPSGAVDVAIAPETCSFARRGDRLAFYRGLAGRLGKKTVCAS